MTHPSKVSLITSSHNPHVRRWRRLLESPGIDQFGQFLVSGERLVREVLSRHPDRCLELILPQRKDQWPVIDRYMKCYQVDQKLFARLDIFGTGFPLLVCRTPDFPVADLLSSPEGLEVLCPLGDPANVGAVIRTAVAMGASKIIVLQESAHPLHPKAVRSSSGAILFGSFYSGPFLREIDSCSSIVGLGLTGENLQTFVWPKHVRILIGEEGKGLGPRGSGRMVTIPMSSGIDSLNASMAAGMAMYAYRLQHPLKGEISEEREPSPGDV